MYPAFLNPYTNDKCDIYDTLYHYINGNSMVNLISHKLKILSKKLDKSKERELRQYNKRNVTSAISFEYLSSLIYFIS